MFMYVYSIRSYIIKVICSICNESTKIKWFSGIRYYSSEIFRAMSIIESIEERKGKGKVGVSAVIKNIIQFSRSSTEASTD